MASVYRDRYDDSKSTVSTTRRETDGGYTKVTRYIVKEDDDTRSNYTSRTKRNDDREREEIRITRREVEEPEPQPRREESRFQERDIVIRSRDESPRRHEYSWDRRDDVDKELIIRRTTDREDPKREERDWTVTRIEERRDSPKVESQIALPRDNYLDRDLQHYSRTAEYYQQPPQPQTIIIRQDPIIIRERIRDDDYQLVKKSDVDDERSVARREEPRDEEYFYEKRVRERIDDDYDRRSRREVSPGDSISQAGTRRRRAQSGYSSDDSMVYVRRVKEDYGSREGSPDRRKNLAAGVIAGVGAAELLRNHRKKEGKDASSGIGRIGRDVGAGALGALAAEGIQRARSTYRDRSRRRSSRSRSYSGDRYDRGRSQSRSRYRSRSRSRSESHSKLKTLGALGLGAAAIAAAATIASRRSKENKEPEKRRSRSRRRRESVESLSSLENDSDATDARNPKHRNTRIAAAGAVGAAGAALIERARSKSRGREGSRDRSRSRLQQGLPIAAAGLGTAALAGLYEKNRAKREAEKIQNEQKREARSRSRNRSQARPNDTYYDEPYGARSGTNLNDPGMIEYGNGPMSGNNFGPDYYGRAPPQEPYYPPQASTAVVPAERSARSRSRSMSRDRRGRRSISPGSASDAGRHSRHRSRDGAAAAGAATAAGGVAAADYERRKAEKKERKARKREQERGGYGRDPYEDGGYQQQNYVAPTPPPAADPYAQPGGFYPHQFPPPPGSMPQQYPGPSITPQPQTAGAGGYQPPQNTFNQQPAYNAPNAYAQAEYNPQNFPPPPTQQMHQQQGFDPYAPGVNAYAPQRSRGADDNVSAGYSPSPQLPSHQHQPGPDGISTSRSVNQPPTINVYPPSQPTPDPYINASVPNLEVPSTYIPPTERPDTPPQDYQNSKHVQFASKPEFSRPESRDTVDTDTISPDAARQRRRTRETNRGYEASDDTDTMPDQDSRTRAYDSNSSSRRQREDRNEESSKRSRNADGDATPRGNRSRDRGKNRERDEMDDRADENTRDLNANDDASNTRRSFFNSNSSRSQQKQDLAEESDDTIEMEPRFDDKGRPKEPSEDATDGKRKDGRGGKGLTGMLLGNFVDGLYGPEGRTKGEGTSKESRKRGSRRGGDGSGTNA